MVLAMVRIACDATKRAKILKGIDFADGTREKETDLLFKGGRRVRIGAWAWSSEEVGRLPLTWCMTSRRTRWRLITMSDDFDDALP
jgi:hypothetical protein